MSEAAGSEADGVSIFQLQGAPARGRIVRLGPASLDPILRRHAYPRPAALMLGEALALAALVGSLLKTDGKLTLQAEGDGPAPLLVAEWSSTGGLRGYVRLDPERAAHLQVDHALAPEALIGKGAMALTLDQGPGTHPMQGVAPLEGESLAECAQTYFAQSEQTPTRVRLAIAEEIRPGRAPLWRGGGVLVQRIAGDDRRAACEEEWRTAEALLATVTDHELVDPELAPDRLLFRLFHELGVRKDAPTPLVDRCTCTRERLTAILTRFTPEELGELREPDGAVHARCQFCGRDYALSDREIAAART